MSLSRRLAHGIFVHCLVTLRAPKRQANSQARTLWDRLMPGKWECSKGFARERARRRKRACRFSNAFQDLTPPPDTQGWVAEATRLPRKGNFAKPPAAMRSGISTRSAGEDSSLSQLFHRHIRVTADPFSPGRIPCIPLRVIGKVIMGTHIIFARDRAVLLIRPFLNKIFQTFAGRVCADS